jgi:cytochrome c oxidase subunit II
VADPARPVEVDEKSDRQHLTRIAIIWVVLSAIFVPLVYFVLGPHLPPGNSTDQAAGQQHDNAVLGAIATPVFLFIWVYLGYALSNWRVPSNTAVGDMVDGPPIRGHRGFQTTWLVVTSVTVLALFVYGTSELVTSSGAGTGSGSAPIWTPAGYNTNLTKSKLLQVQVIGQQWRWTFRFPQYAGVETDQLVLPIGQAVQFNVTSLDVIHSFWAIELGVKADANPGNNNIAFVTPTKTGSFTVRCAELCGTYHGSMYTTGRVTTHSAFDTWIALQILQHRDLLSQLPPYDDFYIPQTDGGYYDPTEDPPPPVDTGLPPATASS